MYLRRKYQNLHFYTNLIKCERGKAAYLYILQLVNSDIHFHNGNLSLFLYLLLYI